MATQHFDSAKELALALSEPERAKLAHELVASLDGPPDANVAELWEAEILQRLEQIDQGDTEFMTPEEVRGRIQGRLAKS